MLRSRRTLCRASASPTCPALYLWGSAASCFTAADLMKHLPTHAATHTSPSLNAFCRCPADGGRRTILFSSFDPDMCAELASRQDAPVMLLSDGGLQLYADPRRNSIQAAIAFASSVGLKGIILETAALRQEQHCVEAAQNQGLQVSRGPVSDQHSLSGCWWAAEFLLSRLLWSPLHAGSCWARKGRLGPAATDLYS